MIRPARLVLALTVVVAFATACGGDAPPRPGETGAAPSPAPKAVDPVPVTEPRKPDVAPAPKVEPPRTEPPSTPVVTPAPVVEKPAVREEPPVVEKPPAPEEPKAPPAPEPKPPVPEPKPPVPEPKQPEPTEPPVPVETPKPPTVVPPPPAPTATPPAAPRWKDAFVGPATCKTCHFKEAKAWAKTPLAKSMDSLRPTAAADAVRFEKKKRAGLDPARDYSTDATCLACHTTGHGGEGGYPADPSATPAATARAAAMGSVSCESCHGPGARYAKFKSDTLAASPDGKIAIADLTPLGLVRPDAAVCATCHNERNPTHADDKFDYETARALVHPVKK